MPVVQSDMLCMVGRHVAVYVGPRLGTLPHVYLIPEIMHQDRQERKGPGPEV